MDLVTVNLIYFFFFFCSENAEVNDVVDDNTDGSIMCDMHSCNAIAPYSPSNETIEQYIECTMKWVKMCVRAVVRFY